MTTLPSDAPGDFFLFYLSQRCHQSGLPLEVFSEGGEAFDSALVNAWGRRNAIWEALVFKEALVSADECFCL